MNQKATKRILDQSRYIEENRFNLVIDCDTHISDTEKLTGAIARKYHKFENLYQGRPISAEDLITEMDMANVDMSLSWINPAAIKPSDPKSNFRTMLEANKYIFEKSASFYKRIIPAGWTDPVSLKEDYALEMIRICVEEFGFPIVKFNPAQNRYNLNSKIVFQMIEYIHSLGAVPAFHMAADTSYTTTEALTEIVCSFPEVPIIAVHMGGGGASYLEAERMYHELRQLGLLYQNIYFIESAKRDIHIESDIITYALRGENAWSHIFCGSDAPYGRMTWNFGGYRLMFESLIDNRSHTDQRVRNSKHVFTKELSSAFLGGNFAKFILQIYDNMKKRYIVNPNDSAIVMRQTFENIRT